MSSSRSVSKQYESIRGAARESRGAVTSWPVERWATTVVGALAGGTDGYAARVEQWAADTIADIDAGGTGGNTAEDG